MAIDKTHLGKIDTTYSGQQVGTKLDVKEGGVELPKTTTITNEEEIKKRREEFRKKREEEAKSRAEAYVKHKELRDFKVKDYLTKGVYVYELYSILIHRGGAFGGHYYAFIKSFEDGKWYEFNDRQVTELDVSSIPTKCFGGSSAMASAYMVMYKKVEAEETLIEITDEEIPDYIKEDIVAEDIRLEEEESKKAG